MACNSAGAAWPAVAYTQAVLARPCGLNSHTRRAASTEMASSSAGAACSVVANALAVLAKLSWLEHAHARCRLLSDGIEQRGRRVAVRTPRLCWRGPVARTRRNAAATHASLPHTDRSKSRRTPRSVQASSCARSAGSRGPPRCATGPACALPTPTTAGRSPPRSQPGRACSSTCGRRVRETVERPGESGSEILCSCGGFAW